MRTRPIESTPEDQRKKYEAHKAANEAVKQLRSCKQYFTAFVIAFAVLEDRVRALDYVARERGKVPQPTDVRRLRDWKQIVKRLYLAELLNHELRDDLLGLADIRNKVVHSAIYNLDAVADKHVTRVIVAQRTVAKLVTNVVKGRQ